MYRFVNFKGFADATLDLRTPVTILIGRNGAGKSNVVEALEFVSGIACGYGLHDVYMPGRGTGRVPIRGGLDMAIRNDEDRFGIQVTLDDIGVSYSVEYGHFDLDKRNSLAKQKHLRERMVVNGAPVLQVIDEGKLTTMQVLLKDNTPGAMSPEILKDWGSASHERGVVDQLAKPTFAQSGATVQVAAAAIVAEAGHVRVLEPDPAAIRPFAPITTGPWARSCSNLAAVLLELHNGPKPEKAKLRILGDMLRDFLEQPVDSIKVMEHEPSKQVTFGLRLQGGRELPASVLSDGTLLELAHATALMTAEAGSVQVLEDIDRGIHPVRVSRLLQFAEKRAKEVGFRVVVTTHSEALLNALTVEQEKGVVVCHWDPVSASAKLTRLQELADYLAVVTAGGLGRAVTNGAVDAAAQAKTPQQQAEALREALAWAESFRSRGDQ